MVNRAWTAVGLLRDNQWAKDSCEAPHCQCPLGEKNSPNITFKFKQKENISENWEWWFVIKPNLPGFLRGFLVCLCQKEFFCVFCAILRKSHDHWRWNTCILLALCSWNRFCTKDRIILFRQNAQCSSGTLDTCLTHLCLLSNVKAKWTKYFKANAFVQFLVQKS